MLRPCVACLLVVSAFSGPSVAWAQPNTPPTMTISFPPTPVQENGSRVFEITINDDAPQNVMLSVVGSSAELAPPSAFTISGTGAQRTVTYEPPFDRSGTVSIDFNLWDPPFPNPTYQGTVSGLSIVPVTAVPRAPTNIGSTATAQAILTWTPPLPAPQSDLPSFYMIEIGDAPGLTAFTPIRIPARTSSVGVTLPNAGYTFRLRPGNRLGIGAVSAEGSVGVVAGPAVPGPPSGLAISLAQNNVATATWAAPGFGASPSLYIIEVGTAVGLADVGRFAVPPVFRASGSLPPGTYAVRIRGVNLAGEGPASPDVFITFPGAGCSLPTAPVLSTILRNGPTVFVPWSAPPTGQAQGYRLAAGSTPGAADIAVLDSSPGSSYFQLAPPAGTYHVFIQALSSCGTSAASNVITYAEPLPAVPGAPRALSGTSGAGTASLAWHPPVTGTRVTSYILEAGFAPGAANIVVPLDSNAPGISFTNVPAGTYFARVRAQNASGTSPVSNEITLTVP